MCQRYDGFLRAVGHRNRFLVLRNGFLQSSCSFVTNTEISVQAWLSGDQTNDGIALVANGKFNATFDSKENTTTSHAPELDIAYAGGEGTITGVTTASGSGLSGGGTSGTLDLSLTNSCAKNQVLQWNGSAWACAAAGTGTITGVTAGTDLTGGGTSGKVTLNVDTTKVPQLAAANTFTGNNIFQPTGTDSIDAYNSAPGKTALVGVQSATSGGSYGVWGQTLDPTAAGVEGVNYGSTQNGGEAIGVYGESTSLFGVGAFGEIGSESAVGQEVGMIASGIWGDAGTGPTGSAFGVFGTADDNEAAGFENNSPVDFPTVGITAMGGGAPLVAAGTVGYCVVEYNGDLDCTGSVNNVVPIDGGARLVATSAIESPVNWFEDAGSAQLVHGVAVVRLDREFIQTVNTNIAYKVFPVPNGDCKGLYVTSKTPTSFEVRELGGGTSSVAFDYRIMAVRRNYENVRFADRTHEMDSIKRVKALRTAAGGKAVLHHPTKSPIPPSTLR